MEDKKSMVEREGWTNEKNKNTHCHQKERGDAFCIYKPLMSSLQTQCELLKSFWDWKIVTNIMFTSRSL